MIELVRMESILDYMRRREDLSQVRWVASQSQQFHNNNKENSVIFGVKKYLKILNDTHKFVSVSYGYVVINIQCHLH